MLPNRSMPPCVVIPVIAYPDVGESVEWLCSVFGFTLRLRIAKHRAQLNAGEGGTVVVTQGAGDGQDSHSVMVRVEDVNRHHERAAERGARVVHAPADYPYGERQYTVEDLARHLWTFSQSIADVDPGEWGGTPGLL
jgi:uncharacterized glyoxalase superfamily protein PhnB